MYIELTVLDHNKENSLVNEPNKCLKLTSCTLFLNLMKIKLKKINKIKCFSDLPTQIFLPLKQETGLLFFLALL
jgi:hypothetical protein